MGFNTSKKAEHENHIQTLLSEEQESEAHGTEAQ